VKDRFGQPNSVYPCTKALTFGPWIYMVPPYKPKDVLILGYAGGTVAGLIKLLYGELPITAVDIEPCEDRYNVNFIQADARDYIKTCSHFDCVVVDLSCNDELGMCDFITSKEFATDVLKIGDFVVVNTSGEMDMEEWGEKIGVNQPTNSLNKIYYYGKIPS